MIAVASTEFSKTRHFLHRQLPRPEVRSLKGGSFWLGLTRESGSQSATLHGSSRPTPGCFLKFRALEVPVADNREGQDETDRDKTLPCNIPEGRRSERNASQGP